jgi:TolB protein
MKTLGERGRTVSRFRLIHQTLWVSPLVGAAIALLYAAPRPLPGPHTIAFGRIGAYQTALFVSNADGSDEHPLLKSTSLDYDPAWSPHGNWIAFTSEREGSADLYRVQLDGTGLERLTDSPAYDDQAAFSPDGDQLVFVTTKAGGTADLWILDVRTRKARPLTSGPGGDFRPSWSPDGKWIAFSSDRGSTLPREQGGQWWVHLQVADIYLIHPDGSGLKRLSEHGNFCGSPKWTRDSRRVVAYCMSSEETFTYRFPPPTEGNTQLVSIDITNGESTGLAAGPGVKMFPVMLPSGEAAYVRKDAGAPGVFYINGARGPGGAVRSPSWSPDGTRLAYHKVLSNQAPDWQKTWSRSPEYDLILTRWLPAFHPGGRLMAATLDADNTRLVLIDTGSNTSRTIFQQAGKRALAPQWSPQGDAIIFGVGSYFRDRAGGAQVATVKPDGSGFRQMTGGANNNGFPSFAPNSQRFVYRTFGSEGQGLRIMTLEGHAVTTLTTDYDNFPLWSPRGDLIIFVREYQGNFDIFSIRPDGKDLRRLTNSPGNDAHMGWSSDGEWIAFSSTRMGFKDEALYTDAPQPYGELFVMRFDGTRVQQVTDNQWEDGGPAWQPPR